MSVKERVLVALAVLAILAAAAGAGEFAVAVIKAAMLGR